MTRRVTVERRPVAVERARGGYDPADDGLPAEVRAAVAGQLRLALTTVCVVVCVLVGLPVVVGLLPAGEGWFVLSVAVQPLWAALAYWHLRRAERLER